MNKSSLLLMAALLISPSCASTPDSDDGKKKDAAAKSPATEAPPEPAPASASAPQEPVDDRVLAASGLGPGGALKPFEIVNCETGESYCQVCKFGPNPKIMAVGTIDDPEFHDDLQNIDAIVKKYGEDKLKAFGVITELRDGHSVTPLREREALQDKVKALRATLNLSLPLVIPSAAEQQPNKTFDGYYNITKSRTLMFADGGNLVKWSEVAPADLSRLNASIRAVLGLDAPAPEQAG